MENNLRKEFQLLKRKLHKIEKNYFESKKICYHYTDNSAYQLIKKNLQLRITNKSFVKDKEDITYPESVLKDCLKCFGDSDFVENEYFNFWGEHFLDNMYCFSTSYKGQNNYVSTSDLYGKSCIKINTKRMFNELKKDKNIQIIKMGYTVYDPVKQKSMLNKLLKIYYAIRELNKKVDIFTEENGLSPSFLEYECKQAILFLLDLFKKSSFSKEKEVRIVFIYNDILKNEYEKSEEERKYYFTNNIYKYCKFLSKS